jgi:hypothetical protein
VQSYPPCAIPVTTIHGESFFSHLAENAAKTLPHLNLRLNLRGGCVAHSIDGTAWVKEKCEGGSALLWPQAAAPLGVYKA